MRWRLSSALRREERKGQGGTLCLCGLGVISGQEEPVASLLCCCDCMTPGMRGEVGRKDVEELTFGGVFVTSNCLSQLWCRVSMNPLFWPLKGGDGGEMRARPVSCPAWGSGSTRVGLTQAQVDLGPDPSEWPREHRSTDMFCF